MAQTRMVFIERIAALVPLRKAVVAGFDRQRRGSDRGIQREHFVDMEQVRVHDLVRGVAQDMPAACSIGRGPVLRQPQRLVLVDAAVGLAQPLGHAF